MGRTVGGLAVAAALVGLGWVAGKAQSRTPDFEIAVSAPVGDTHITCVRGCTLAWVERGLKPNNTPVATFSYACGPGGATPGRPPTPGRCESGSIGGWLTH
jgi:hypothetical protein